MYLGFIATLWCVPRIDGKVAVGHRAQTLELGGQTCLGDPSGYLVAQAQLMAKAEIESWRKTEVTTPSERSEITMGW